MVAKTSLVNCLRSSIGLEHRTFNAGVSSSSLDGDTKVDWGMITSISRE